MRHKGKTLDTSQWATWFLQEGLSTYQIAERAGATGAYVSEVLNRQGIEVRKIALERLHAKRAATEKEKLARRLERTARNRAAQEARNRQLAEEKYRPWRELWDEGNTIVEMAEILGRRATSLPTQIHLLRLRYGWFPRRR